MSVRTGPEIDRWLMRAKDVLQILIALGSVVYVAYQFVSKIDRMQDSLMIIRTELVELKTVVNRHIERGKG